MFFLICFCVSADYFYMDKKYADILTANSICAKWCINETQMIPAELIKFAVTSGEVKSNDSIKRGREFLYPSEVIYFADDGNFTYMWQEGLGLGEIHGKWRVENSTLIFTFIDDKYPAIYAKDSELRYYIVKIANLAETSLKFKGESYPAVTNIMASSDSPVKDFEKIATRIQESAINI